MNRMTGEGTQEFGNEGEKRKVTGSGKEWSSYKRENTLKYCFYFNVTLEGYSNKDGVDIFTFTLKSILNPEIFFSIDKRYSEFTQFVNEVKSQQKARPPALPGKLIIKDESHLERRARDLEEWLLIVSNERIFHTSYFFEFVGFPKELRNQCMSHNPLASMDKDYDFDINVEAYEHVDSKEKFMAFSINIEVFSRKMQGMLTSYKLTRRYREFDFLHSHLKKKFYKYTQPLPEFPSKLVFLRKSTLSKRQFKLENYLRLLINYPNIFDSVYFRKFMNIHPDKYGDSIFYGICKEPSGGQKYN